MTHEDANQTPGRAAPSVAFDRAMEGVDTRSSDLMTLLDTGSLDRIEHVARSAANLWLTGRSAYRRLVERDQETSLHVVAARQRLESAYVLLLHILRRAHAQAKDHPTRSQLDDVRIELVTAAAHPDSAMERR
jgi:hypothetical protein